MTINASLAGPHSASLLRQGTGSAEETQQALAIENNDAENATSFDADESGSDSGLQSLSALFTPSTTVMSVAAGEVSPEDLGANLITFSKLSEAQALLGQGVTTRFFQKVDIGGVVYLQPLKQNKPSIVDLTDISKYQPTYVPIGQAIPYTASSLPSAAKFSAMHSSDQAALLILSGTLTDGSYSLTFKDTNANPILTAVLSSDNTTVYIVEKLDKSRFANMSYADQVAISKTPAFETLKLVLGLDATKADIEAAIQNRIDALEDAFNKRLPTIPVTFSGDVPSPALPLTDRVGFFTNEHLKLFTDQMEMIRNSANNDLAVYNKAQIDDQLAAIMERFERALAFGDLPVHPSDLSDPSAAVRLVGQPGAAAGGGNVGATAYVNLMSLDMNVTVKAGFDSFIAQEHRRVDAEKEVEALIYRRKHPDPNNPTPKDAPQLIFQLQLYRNIIAEAELACISEEVRQQNDLIKSYSKAQAGLADTMKVNGPTPYLGLGKEGHVTKYTAETTLAISMFQTNAGAAGALAPLHPIEKLRNITRPRIDAFNASGAANTKALAEWSQSATQLKDAVSIIGQDIQDKSNKANSVEKDKTRNSQLASQVNTKMYEAILALARMGF